MATLSSCTLKLSPPNVSNKKSEPDKSEVQESVQEEKIATDSLVGEYKNFVKIRDWYDLKNILTLSSSDNKILESKSRINNLPKIKNDLIDSLRVKNNKNKIFFNLDQSKLDLIKSDKRFLYLAKGTSVFVYGIEPVNTGKFSKELKFNNNVNKILVGNNRLLVFTISDYKDSNAISNNFTSVYVFDSSDRLNIKELTKIDIEGGAQDAIMFNDKLLYLSTVKQFVFTSNKASFPKILKNSQEIYCLPNNTCEFPEIYSIESACQRTSYLNFHTVDVHDTDISINSKYFILPTNFKSSIINGELFISYNNYLNEAETEIENLNQILFNKLPSNSQEILHSIEKNDLNILSQIEKYAKTRSIYNSFLNSLSDNDYSSFQNEYDTKLEQNKKIYLENGDKTILHKILSNKQDKTISESIELAGTIFAENAVHEYGAGYLAGTEQKSPETGKQQYDIYFFDKQFTKREEVNKISSILKLNTISVIDDTLFLSDSENTNSFLSLDLNLSKLTKNPDEFTIPKNELIFAPLKNQYFFGIKNKISAEINSENLPLEIELYKVAAKSELILESAVTIGESGAKSMALKNTDLISFSPEKYLLSIPLTAKSDKKGIFGNQDFNGVVIIGFDNNRISLNGLIEHSGLIDIENNRTSIDIKQTLFSNDIMYTVSDSGIKINATKGFNELKSFIFNQ